ncbi:hypothetical protein [Leptospira andrefontaineae]|uniref:Uncharacterized protein n=1 Tax=Leptospira andrefontaineae TaxID=2484976 RepID=A0A4R9H6K6_9LEPT|nr:hypothetical protein [Leptospira andrefontaineae]TGK41231.1 hypothetical protein EHO65_07315 [Leptospira andrefontaineae]
MQTQNSNLTEWAKSFAIKYNKDIDDRFRQEHRDWTDAQIRFRDKFKETVELVNEFSSFNKVEVFDHALLDYENYLKIKGRAAITKTWFFKLNFQYMEEIIRYLFYYGSSSPLLREKQTEHSLFISREEPGISGINFVKLDKIESSVPGIREIAYSLVDRKFYVRSKAGHTENVYTYSPEIIAKTLFDDIYRIHF